jgi:hypothetical protein
MAMVQPDLASLVAGYARTFHDVIGYEHHVASPLSAWLLLALCSPAASGAEAAALAEVLGGGPDEVAGLAASLLTEPHPLVAAAAGVWGKGSAASPSWLDGLPAAVARGGIPSQAELDAWARQHTFGLIERFPLVVTDQVYLLLATALATKVSWDCPFELTPATALGPTSIWPQKLAQVLKSPEHPSHLAFIATTTRAGDVAVHVAEARGGLLVASVIARPQVPAPEVLAAALELAIAVATGSPVPRRSLFDLPLGDGPLWTISEEPAGAGARERCHAVLPAWTATDRYELDDPRLGFGAAAKALGGADPWQAAQAATATYSRTGFEAAAVTAMAIAMAMFSRSGQQRVAELRFGHPYAAVAVTSDPSSGPWRGVPVFSAWITEPVNAGDK